MLEEEKLLVTSIFPFSHNVSKKSLPGSLTLRTVWYSWLVVLGFNATLTAKVISWRSVTLSHTSTNTTFLPKATDYFSHMLLQRWEGKIRRKESVWYRINFYYTIPTFNNPVYRAFWKHCWKRKKYWLSANILGKYFPTIFSTLPQTNFNFSVTFILSSANAFNLDQSKILLFGTELKWFTLLRWLRVHRSSNFNRFIHHFFGCHWLRSCITFTALTVCGK